MSDLVRFGVSIDADLLEFFDKLIEQKGYKNRSEAIRDLIRDQKVQEEWDEDKETVGTITLVYDHHVRELAANLTHLQHSFTGQIISVMHVHLDHNNCLEVLVVKGKSHVLQSLADQLTSVRGVKHGKLTATTTGEEMTSAAHTHDHPTHSH